MHLFIYYKFLPSEHPDLESSAKQLLAQVQVAVPGVKVQLLKRPDVNDRGEHTWMEAYECESERFEALQAEVHRLAGELALPKGRRVEVFVEI